MRIPLLAPSIGCVIGCAGWLLFGRWDGQAPSDAEAARAQSRAPIQVSIVDALSMPLFSVPRSAAPPAPQANPKADLRLIGISFTPRRRAAFFSSGGQTFWLAVGQGKDGVVVTRLERTAVEVQGAGEVRRLELFRTPRPPVQTARPEFGPPGSRAREPASAPPPTPATATPGSGAAAQPNGARE